MLVFQCEGFTKTRIVRKTLALAQEFWARDGALSVPSTTTAIWKKWDLKVVVFLTKEPILVKGKPFVGVVQIEF